MPGVSSKVPYFGFLSLLSFFYVTLFSLTQPCSVSFQGNCLQNKDPKQRSSAQCGMFDVSSSFSLIVSMKIKSSVISVIWSYVGHAKFWFDVNHDYIRLVCHH